MMADTFVKFAGTELHDILFKQQHNLLCDINSPSLHIILCILGISSQIYLQNIKKKNLSIKG